MKYKKIIYITTATVVLLALFYDVVLFGGNIQFYAKWAQCRMRPVQAEGAPGSSVVWYEEGPTFSLVRSKKWYCTPLEAEQAGFSASRHAREFPHLNKETQ